MLLEEYVRLHGAKLRPLEPDTELTRKLGRLVENRRGLVDERHPPGQSAAQPLKDLLSADGVLFDDLTTPLAALFLLKWPDLAAVKKAGGRHH